MVGSAKLPWQFEAFTFTHNICFLCRESCGISTFIFYRVLYSFVCEHHVHFVLDLSHSKFISCWTCLIRPSCRIRKVHTTLA